ncbi:MAG: HutD family protein [Oscillospiraceae bacterium]
MNIQKIIENEFKVSNWAGGKTSQVAIFPIDRNYADRDFNFRISSATVDGGKSNFTNLPNYNRFLTVLSGEIMLENVTTNQKLRLFPYEVYAFDGGDDIISEGKCKDFNLMIRKNTCCGDMTVLNLSNNSEKVSVKSYENLLIFCATGEVTITDLENQLSLKPFEAAILKGRNEIIVSSLKDAVIILCHMHQND